MSMKKILILTTTLLVFANMSYSQNGISYSITTDYNSKYIWRGQNINDDPVFQPGFSISWNGFTAAWWANTDTTKINNENGEFTEHDWSLDYSGEIPFCKTMEYSIGLVNYYFPSLEDTTEMYCGFGLDIPFEPSITFNFDVDDIKGTYASFSIGHSIENIAKLTPNTQINMEMGASLGWGSKSYNKGYWGTIVDSSKLNDLSLSLSFPFVISDWNVTPSINYVTLMTDAIRNTDAFNKSSDYLIIGIGITKNF